MQNSFRIIGGEALRGEIDILGCKNAATPILAATILASRPCIIANLPRVSDVFTILDILERLGADITYITSRKIRIDTRGISPAPDFLAKAIGNLRSTVLLLGPLLARFGKVTIAKPGGCSIGKRPLTAHLQAFRDLGCSIEEDNNFVSVRRITPRFAGEVVLDEFSVTATENILMFLAANPGKVSIAAAAAEPHVQDLICFLQKLGTKITGSGTHNLTIYGKRRPGSAEHRIIQDPIEAGTFAVAGLATRGSLKIKNFPFSYNHLFFKKLERSGARLKKQGRSTLEILPSVNMCASRIQALPYPGIPTDLQPLLGVLAVKMRGETLIHDPMYEARMGHLQELKKMGARINLLDPHRALVRGPSALRGARLTNKFDLRGGAALTIAGLTARGETILKNISPIDRGYEDFDSRLRQLGANIERI